MNSCKFCGNHLDPAILGRLHRYFTDELQELKTRIEAKIADLNEDAATTAIELDSSKLLPDLVTDYLADRESAEKQGAANRSAIQTLIERLREKKDRSRWGVELVRVPYPQESLGQYNVAVRNLNALIERHNERLPEISKEIDAAAKSIELHTVAKILRGKDYFNNRTKRNELAGKIQPLRKEIDGIGGQIKAKKATLRNASVAVEKINAILQEFFGGSRIYLEVTDPASGEVGYVLKRRGRDAKHLSEGEKSVLALVYYLTKLEEDGFKKENGLIIIDDPVDSQDAIFLFRTFAFVKRQLKGAGQVIILTHNFEFFNLCRDWLLEKAQVDESQFYFISICQGDVGREMRVTDLPALLKQYKSQYQYLFCRLYRYAKGLEPLDDPLVPNISRKILEYFAAFKWSCKSTEQFANIVLNRFIKNDEERRNGTGDFVVKFVNEYSHGQDFSRPVSAPMFEAKDIADQILRFIELADEDHFDALATLCR